MADKICVPIQAATIADLNESLTAAQKEADFIEIWLDQITALTTEDIPQIVNEVKKPLIVVCKGRKERGAFKGGEEKRVAFLREALRAGADYADVGIHTDPKLIKSLKKEGKIIISYHNFKNTPRLSSLKKTIEKAQKLGADIIKIATFANSKADNLAVLQLVAEYSARGQKIIGLCMGKEGRLSRIYSTQMGGFLMFAPISKNAKSAPGQLTLKELKLAIKKAGC